MVTFWNFDITLSYLTLSLALAGILLTIRNINRPLIACFKFCTGIVCTNSYLRLILSACGLLLLIYLALERHPYWTYKGTFTFIGVLPFMIFFSQISQKSYATNEKNTDTKIQSRKSNDKKSNTNLQVAKPKPTTIKTNRQTSNSKTISSDKKDQKNTVNLPEGDLKDEKIKELEERLHTAELTLAYTTRSLRQEQEKRKFEQTKRQQAEIKAKRLEQALLPQKHGLKEFSDLLCQTQQLVNMGSWEWKPESNDLFWSTGILRIHELDADESMTIKQSLQFIHPEYRSTLKHALHMAAEKNQAFDVDIKLVTAHKRTIWVRVVGKPVCTKDEPKKIQGLYINIDHEKKSERALVDLTKNLSQHLQTLKEESARATEEMDEFSYIVSHDLRAPMRVIDGFSAILEEDYSDKLDEEGFETIQTIQANVSKLNLMMNELLVLSAIGRKPMSREEINTCQLLKQTINTLKTDGIEFSESLPNILGDHNMINQLFTNLITNAIKFAKNHGDHQIEIGHEKTDMKSRSRFYVRDQGIGFDMKFHHKVFRAFKKLDKADAKSGVGMGLTIAKKIVERHQGKIWAQSKEGLGTTIYIELPTPRAKHADKETVPSDSTSLILDFQSLLT